MDVNQIKVYLLTGFLGAGKTTVLNHLLGMMPDKRNVVIENEFGKASVDGSLITQSYSELYELSNGCICCSLDEELYDVLTMLANAEQRPDNLFIETTGVADAGTVAAIFKREDVAKVFGLQKVICVADAENVEDYLGETNETLRQLVSADLILINKSALVSAEYALKLQALMKTVNPFAEVIFSIDGSIPDPALIAASTEEPEELDTSNLDFTKTGKHKIVSVTYKTENAFYRDYLLHALNVTLMIHYKQVYRIKGFVKLEGSEEKFLLQSTGKRLSLESYGSWETDEPVSELVFIGIGLEMPTIQRILRPAIKAGKPSLKETGDVH